MVNPRSYNELAAGPGRESTPLAAGASAPSPTARPSFSAATEHAHPHGDTGSGTSAGTRGKDDAVATAALPLPALPTERPARSPRRGGGEADPAHATGSRAGSPWEHAAPGHVRGERRREPTRARTHAVRKHARRR